ncbi:MAG: aminoglycoside phosphotransferase family protein [Chloroflexi bacterium]|nr:aminoglycoside phosphotransferase family protein [Chloroflexota bacterium]
MLEKPALPDGDILDLLREAYGLQPAGVVFLPLGADVHTAVYRVADAGGQAYFLKLRGGVFDENPVRIAALLHERGIRQAVPVVRTCGGGLWARLEDFTCTLSPFIVGRDGFEQELTDAQWLEFGAALRAVHSLDLPDDLRAALPREDWSARWREAVRGWQAQAESAAFADPLAARMAAFLRDHRAEVDFLLARAEQLATGLAARRPDCVLCHADIHAGNLLLAEHGELYIVDWDTALLAPRERDLMFIGAGIGGTWQTEREAALFYCGYGQVEIDRAALAYYRYERILEDIAAFCAQILPTAGDSEDRERGFGFFISNFAPGGEIETARQGEEGLK